MAGRDTSDGTDVIVLGAGAAGLAAARELSGAGRTVVLVEARDRVGGRVWTHREADFPVPIELGADFVHGWPPEQWEIIRAAGLRVYEIADTHRRLTGGKLEPIDFWGAVERVMGRLDADTAADEPFAAWAERHRGDDPDAMRLATAYVEGFNAADATRISARGVAEAEAAAEEIDGTAMFRLADGYAGMIEWLRAGLDPARATVRLNAIATDVRWRRGRVEVDVRSALAPAETARRETLVGQQLIVTLPLGVLQAPGGAVGAVRFDPGIDDKLRAARRLAMGPVTRATLRFREPFWEILPVPTAPDGKPLRDLCFMHAPDEPRPAFGVWWTLYPVHAPVLVGWAGGPPGERLSGRGGAFVRDAAIDSLVVLFGLPRDAVERQLVSCHSHDWQADPFARGAYSYVPVGGLDAMRALAEPVDGTLLFAGEATHHEGMSGTVAGAIASGRRAAREAMGGAR